MSTLSSETITINRGRVRTYIAGSEPQPVLQNLSTPQRPSVWAITNYSYYNPIGTLSPPLTPINSNGIITRIAKKFYYFHALTATRVFEYYPMGIQPNVYGNLEFSEYEGDLLVGGTVQLSGILEIYIGGTPLPGSNIDASGNYVNTLWYESIALGSFVSEYEYFETYKIDKSQIDISQPTYSDLLYGYGLDTRSIQQSIQGLISDRSFSFKYQFYRKNPLEQLPITTIDWITYEVDTINGISFDIDFAGIVLGTFFCNDLNIENQIKSHVSPDKYPLLFLFQENLSSLFSYWRSLVVNSSPLPMISFADYRSTYSTRTISSKLICSLAENRNCWANNIYKPTSKNLGKVINGVNTEHPLFNVNPTLENSRHFNLQPDGSLGTIVADSPRTIDILTIANQNKVALTALKVTLDAVKLKVDTLNSVDVSTLATSSSIISLRTVADATKLKVDTLAPTDISTLATATSIVDIKAELDGIEASVNQLKVEIL